MSSLLRLLVRHICNCPLCPTIPPIRETPPRNFRTYQVCVPVHRRKHKGIISELRLRSGHGMTRRHSSREGFWLECCHIKGRIAIVRVVKSSALACQARRAGIIASSSRFARKSQSIRRRQRRESNRPCFWCQRQRSARSVSWLDREVVMM